MIARARRGGAGPKMGGFEGKGTKPVWLVRRSFSRDAPMRDDLSCDSRVKRAAECAKGAFHPRVPQLDQLTVGRLIQRPLLVHCLKGRHSRVGGAAVIAADRHSQSVLTGTAHGLALRSKSQNTPPAITSRIASQPKSGMPVSSGSRTFPKAATGWMCSSTHG